MKILAIGTVYNEIDYLPLKLAWCKANGIELYVIDNFSTDGTWEWCQANNIPSHRFDTEGAFHLDWLQSEMMATLAQIKPDWVVYQGADTFFANGRRMDKVIGEVDARGFSAISYKFFNLKNTGEEVGEPFDPFSTFCYGNYGRVYPLVNKYHPSMRYDGDSLYLPDLKVKQVNGLMLNYGDCKGSEYREETYRRRQKAWELGLRTNKGRHYHRGHNANWQWGKESLLDIRDTDDYKYLLHLQEQIAQ